VDYKEIFEGREFEADGRTWTASVENSPGAHGNATDLIIFDLSLKEKTTGEVRKLRLLSSDAGIHVLDHTPQLHGCVRLWLRGGDTSGEVKCY